MTAPHYTDELVTLHHGDCLDVLRTLPDASVDSIVTDPPYGLANTTSAQVAETITAWIAGDREYLPGGSGFMGKAWDAFVPPVAVWDEAMRVLKPGGHLLAFAGSRTFDLMALAIRLAGFDVRDSIAWLYGSGFPKSRDVSDAMQRFLTDGPQSVEAAARPGIYEVTAFLRAARDAAGWTNRRIDELFGTNGMAGHWTTSGTQPAVPSPRQWQALKDSLGFDDSMDELAASLASTERPEDWGANGPSDSFPGSLSNGRDGAASAGGWGTALKPAFEPVVVARKPLAGTVASNVLTHGTGALNIDGCRVEGEPRTTHADGNKRTRNDGPTMREGFGIKSEPTPAPSGRWPTNVVLDESQAAELDRQSGTSTSRRAVLTSSPGDVYAGGKGLPSHTGEYGYDDAGGASRFFPTFRYEAKAPTSERPRTGETAHPTVKPLDLMRWLVRLVTPPGGLVLEPFAGSGTTAEACVIEGLRCIAIEREADYLPLIVQRLTKPIEPVLDFGALA